MKNGIIFLELQDFDLFDMFEINVDLVNLHFKLLFGRSDMFVLSGAIKLHNGCCFSSTIWNWTVGS